MEQTSHIVMHQTNEYPSGLKTAAEMAASLDSIPEDRLNELANAGYLPHYRVDGGSPMFRAGEVKQWIASNLMGRCEGRSIPDAIRLVVAAPEVSDRPPPSIMNLPGLQQMPSLGYQPGVYFLCKKDEVVYVGQSITPSSRVNQHIYERRKEFDRVYLFPVPESELNNVEGAFILHLMPSQQGGLRNGRATPTRPTMTKTAEEVLQEIARIPTTSRQNDRRQSEDVALPGHQVGA